jgi:hypothetical protein
MSSEAASTARHLRFNLESERERSATVDTFVPVGKQGKTERATLLLVKKRGAWLISQIQLLTP